MNESINKKDYAVNKKYFKSALVILKDTRSSFINIDLFLNIYIYSLLLFFFLNNYDFKKIHQSKQSECVTL